MIEVIFALFFNKFMISYPLIIINIFFGSIVKFVFLVALFIKLVNFDFYILKLSI